MTVERGALLALGRGERIQRHRRGALRDVASGPELLAAGDELATLALDGDGPRLTRAHEVSHVRFVRRERIGRDLQPTPLALRLGGAGLRLPEPRRRSLALQAELRERALRRVELLVEAPVHPGDALG